MGKLTTHVLDTSTGQPAVGLRVELFLLGPDPRKLAEAVTNSDGRCDTPLLEGAVFQSGTYELHFHAGDYLKSRQFLDLIPIRFRVADASAHYHVPLLLSPFGYSTYRGS